MNIKSTARSVLLKLSSIALVCEAIYLLIENKPNQLILMESVGCLGLSFGSFVYSFGDSGTVSQKSALDTIPPDYGAIDV
jgi:hypothetical protein